MSAEEAAAAAAIVVARAATDKAPSTRYCPPRSVAAGTYLASTLRAPAPDIVRPARNCRSTLHHSERANSREFPILSYMPRSGVCEM